MGIGVHAGDGMGGHHVCELIDLELANSPGEDAPEVVVRLNSRNPPAAGVPREVSFAVVGEAFLNGNGRSPRVLSTSGWWVTRTRFKPSIS